MGKVFSSCVKSPKVRNQHEAVADTVPSEKDKRGTTSSDHLLSTVSSEKDKKEDTSSDHLLGTEPHVSANCETVSSVRDFVPAESSPDPSQLPHKDYMDHPLVLDKCTIEYVKNSKVMVILKGLPGSGKSVIARRLREVYEGTVVCSADDFFMHDGVYKFEFEKLKDAHKACQAKAQEAAERGEHVVVIDNTNVKAWESKYYLQLASKNKYVVLIVEPQTPWAMDAAVLSQRNSHGVSEEVLKRKVKEYEKVLPLYFWWFLNEGDSEAVGRRGQEWLRKALQIPQFFNDFAEFSKLTAVDDMLCYFCKSRQSGGYGLHATACVTRRGKEKNSLGYINSAVVKGSLGKCFDLCIIGYVITPRAFGARLRLGERELELWGMDDNEIEQEDTQPEAEESSADVSEQSSLITNTGEVSKQSTNHYTTLTVLHPELKSDRFHPTSGKGSRAHLTLGCAPGIHAKVTGFDLIKAISCEQKLGEDKTGMVAQKVESYKIHHGVLKSYGEALWVIYPEEEVVVRSLFAPYY